MPVPFTMQSVSIDAARPIVVAAHPDDEIIGAGAQLRRWPQTHVVVVTDGAPPSLPDARRAGFATSQAYALARQRESMTALALAGILPDRVHALEFPEQGASFHLVEITLMLLEQFLELQPDFIVTHPYEGGHPDHDATAFAVHTACALLREEDLAAPVIFEMTSYHNRAGTMATGEFLPADDSHGDGDGEIATFVLDDEERAFKRRLLACFKTQQSVLQYFQVAIERFRPAPCYDFTEPPHPGPLYYELFDWGLTGDRWRTLAQEAQEKVRLLTVPR
jgi:LmbE family N-acetylglucosaminyl deacetylase